MKMAGGVKFILRSANWRHIRTLLWPPHREWINTRKTLLLAYLWSEEKTNMNNCYKKEKRKTIAVAGTLDLDIVPVFGWEEVRPIEEIVVPGHVIENRRLTVNAGGCVSYTGLGLAKLGVDVLLMGKVGKDVFGNTLRGLLSEYASTEYIIASEACSTSTSIVLTFPGYDRIFIYASNAEDTFTIEEVNFDVISNCAIFHFGYPNGFEYLFRNKGEKCIEMFRRIKRSGTVTSLDMAMVDIEAPVTADWETMIKGLMPYVDLFEPSIEELSYYIDRDEYFTLLERAKIQQTDITQVMAPEYIYMLAERLVSWGAGVVLIKCGAKGMYLRCGSKEKMGDLGGRLRCDMSSWANVSHFERAYKPERFRAATGAGDISIAGFLAAIIQGYDWERCIQLAAAAGATCVTTYDTISAICPLEELNAKIEKGWEKNDEVWIDGSSFISG